MVFTADELEYLRSQPLGRLATLAPEGTLQNSPVSHTVDEATGVISIYGYHLGDTRKFRNVAANGQVAYVVDDIASLDPWSVRGVEIRGTAQALRDITAPAPHLSPEVIRIHPHRIISWNLGTDGAHSSRRTVTPTAQ
ncbi:PPOX class F420-dependent oxidoreductase [Frankia sp. Ag45/Mut15]|uniref:PPOX class F420-dependent oxidoreductase n=1 Tax=Frankia umida TaxID=573489 RepID=A0ABT0K395_9ACTN|nr:PPOX class F420-dependent oxidoreductase [Frankia umida]MCK9878211.1 PPOX class F420-dependent oxidoreductase [Frankia umida]